MSNAPQDPNLQAEVTEVADQLAQLQSYVATGLAAPLQVDAWTAELGERIGAIHAAAEEANNPQLMRQAKEAWDFTLAIATQANYALQTATVAVSVATTLQGQRDTAVAEMAELETALDNHDLHHPLIKPLAAAVANSAYEEGQDDAEAVAYDNIIEEIAVGLCVLLNVRIRAVYALLGHVQAAYAAYQYGMDADSQFAISAETLAKLAAAVSAAGEELFIQREAENQRREKTVAELDAQFAERQRR